MKNQSCSLILRLKQKIMLLSVFALAASLTQYSLCMEEAAASDPLRSVDYRAAFDQTKLHEKFSKLLKHWGCYENVQKKTALNNVAQQTQQGITSAEPGANRNPDSEEEDHLLISIQPDRHDFEQLAEQYRKEALRILNAARRWAVLKPTHESATMMGILLCSSVVSSGLLGTESMGNGINIGLVVINCAYLFRAAIRSTNTWRTLPADALQSLEEYFALNQCFIPQAIWPAIIKKFMMGRANQFEQSKAINFLEFGLGLTLLKPRSPRLRKAGCPEEIIRQLNQKIDVFFNDYEVWQDRQTVNYIKANTGKFIAALMNQETKTRPRFTYLHGPGGIGKTYFARQLYQWIAELLPETVSYESPVIATAAELEGNNEKPSAFLVILRNCLQEDKMGSVVFIDEANWLNEGPMNAATKRVFSDNQSQLSTNYFGSDLEGRSLTVCLPLMLLILAGNDTIKDEALKSRFDVVTFPMPGKQALASYARVKAEESRFGTDKRFDDNDTMKWIDDKEIKSFRQIESEIDPLLISLENNTQ